MIIELIIFILTFLVVYSVYNYFTNHEKFKSTDVKFSPGVPIFGNSLKSALMVHHPINDIEQAYNAFPEEKYIGYIEGMVPILLIRDPALIKLITVKDFDHFADHRTFFSDELFNDSLLMMKGDRWRDMRATLSPAFTGSKMRLMVPFMIEIMDNIIEYLKETEGQVIAVDNLVRRYTNDVIASAAFGLKVNSVKDENNEFYKIGQQMVNFTFVQRMKMLLLTMAPKLGQYITVFPPENTVFFKDLVSRTMEYREKNNIERPDMIQLLMEAAKGTLKASTDAKHDNIGFATVEDIKLKQTGRTWSKDEIAAQAFIFFFAGYESSAAAAVMTVHELAVNPDIQEKLYQEVSQYKEKALTYETIQELKYMDAVLSETLRKWSPAIILDRICLKPYTLPPPHKGGQPYNVKLGDILYCCVNAQHMDEKYYPEPQKFEPDRFSEANKQNVKQFSYLPFGVGPRNCIGSRFALLELKIFLYYLLLNFKIEKCSKTLDPIRLEASVFNIRADGGTHVTFKRRRE